MAPVLQVTFSMIDAAISPIPGALLHCDLDTPPTEVGFLQPPPAPTPATLGLSELVIVSTSKVH